MRVALCLYGQPRFYNSKSFETLKTHVIDRWNADVFFHTWWDPSEVGTYYEAAPWSRIPREDLYVEDGVVDELVGMYKPVAWLAEKQREFKDDDYTGNCSDANYHPSNIVSMFYTWKESGRLKREHEKKEGFKYDWVIRARFDTFIESALPDMETFEKGACYVPDTCSVCTLVHDSFSVSDSRVHDLQCETFDHLKEFFIRGIMMSHERMFMFQMKENGVEIVKRKDILQGFIRGDTIAMVWPRYISVEYDNEKHLLSKLKRLPNNKDLLKRIMNMYIRRGNHVLATVFGMYAFEIDPCREVAEKLSISAYYAGRYRIGEEAARKALSFEPGNQQLKHNLGFYTSRGN